MTGPLAKSRAAVLQTSLGALGCCLALLGAGPATAADQAAQPAAPDRGQREILADAPDNSSPALYHQELLDPRTLGVGRIARDVAEHLPSVEAMAEYLDSRVADIGFVRARPVMARDNAEMADYLRRGLVDLLSETPMSAVHLMETTGSTLLLRERRRGISSYGSVVFVRDDSPIASLEDLRGRRMAFEDSGSTTAFLLPLAAVRRKGLRTVRLEDATSPPVEDAVGYYFTLSETAITTAVIRRAADAGALSDEEWRAFARRKPEAARQLRIVHESDPVPRAFVLAGPALTTGQRDRLRALLLEMNTRSQDRDVLRHYGRVDGFDPIDDEIRASVATLEATHDLLREEMR